MPAADWARGARLAAGERLADGAGRRGPAPAAAPEVTAPSRTRPAGAYDLLRAVAEQDAYANLVLPAAAARARARRPRRRAAPPSSATARCAPRARSTRSSARASTGRSAGSSPRCSTCCGWAPTSCWHAGAAARRGRHDGRTGSAGGRAAPGFVNAVLRRVAARRPGTPGWPARRRRRRGRRLGTRASALAPANGSSAAFARRARRRPGRAARPRCSPPTTSGRAYPSGRPAGPARPRRAGRGVRRRAGPWSPYAVRLPGGDPAALARCATRRAAVQDEGSQLVRARAGRAPVDGRDERWLDLCAGPGGKAALLAALARRARRHA